MTTNEEKLKAARQYLKLKAEADEAKALADAAADDLMAVMADKEKLSVITPDGLRTITKVYTAAGTRLDTVALKKACPEIVAKYQTSTKEKRYLKVTK